MHACQARVRLRTCTLLMTLTGMLPQCARQAMAAPGALNLEEEIKEVKAEIKDVKKKLKTLEEEIEEAKKKPG